MVDLGENGCFLVKRGAPQSPVAEMTVKPCHILRILEVRNPENHVIFMSFQHFRGITVFAEIQLFLEILRFHEKVEFS